MSQDMGERCVESTHPSAHEISPGIPGLFSCPGTRCSTSPSGHFQDPGFFSGFSDLWSKPTRRGSLRSTTLRARDGCRDVGNGANHSGETWVHGCRSTSQRITTPRPVLPSNVPWLNGWVWLQLGLFSSAPLRLLAAFQDRALRFLRPVTLPRTLNPAVLCSPFSRWSPERRHYGIQPQVLAVRAWSGPRVTSRK